MSAQPVPAAPAHASAVRTPPDAVRHAVRCTLLYADLFDYPLSAAEAHRYLVGVAAPPASVAAALDAEVVAGFLGQQDGRYFLAGRETAVATRERRAAVARRRWPQAYRYGRLIAALPFVRMVAVTGSLAMDNAGPDEDIDFLIVTAPGRLWLCRAFVILIVRLAALFSRVTLCPNYLVTTERTILGPQDFFSAHEFAQMRPLHGAAVFRLLLRQNGWVADSLPNAFPPLVQAAQDVPPFVAGGVQRDLERLLLGRAGGRLETWERERKVRRLLRRAQVEGGRVAFTPEECRGHFGGHELRIAAAYRERLARYGVTPPAHLDLRVDAPDTAAGSGPRPAAPAFLSVSQE